MAHLAGRLPRRRSSVHRVANRQLLRYDGYRIALHAGPHGHHRRPLDPRAEAAGHLPAHQRRFPRRSRLANRLRPPVHLHVDERHVLHAHHCPLELGGLQCPRPGETRCREALPAHPGLGYGRLHRRHVVRRSGSDRRRTDQTDLLATVRFGPPLPDSRDLLVHAAGLSRQPARKGQSWSITLGLRAFALFKEKRMAIFFIFSMLLGAARCRSPMPSATVISRSFGTMPQYADLGPSCATR